MNFKGNYIKIGNVDITRLKQRVSMLSDAEWQREDWRQKQYDAHKNTETIALIFDMDFRHEDPTILPEYKLFESLIEPAARVIRAHFNKSLKARRLYKKFGCGYFVRMNLVRLLPAGVIAPHLDRNYSLTHAHRIHLPIITNDNTGFVVGDEAINMKEGDIWEINNRRVHSVLNAGDKGRVHLILDWVVPGESCCCSKHTHLGIPCSPEACSITDNAIEPCTCYL